jgi:hypothetical protein
MNDTQQKQIIQHLLPFVLVSCHYLSQQFAAWWDSPWVMIQCRRLQINFRSCLNCSMKQCLSVLISTKRNKTLRPLRQRLTTSCHWQFDCTESIISLSYGASIICSQQGNLPQEILSLIFLFTSPPVDITLRNLRLYRKEKYPDLLGSYSPIFPVPNGFMQLNRCPNSGTRCLESEALST